MDTKTKLEIRDSFTAVEASEKGKKRGVLVWVKMRDGARYYRGIRVSDKKVVTDNFSAKVAEAVKYKEEIIKPDPKPDPGDGTGTIRR